MENREGLPGSERVRLRGRHARQIVKDAFAAKVIGDGQVWIDMLDHRNLLFHTYSLATFDEAVKAIHTRYLAAIGKLHEFLRVESLK